MAKELSQKSTFLNNTRDTYCSYTNHLRQSTRHEYTLEPSKVHTLTSISDVTIPLHTIVNRSLFKKSKVTNIHPEVKTMLPGAVYESYELVGYPSTRVHHAHWSSRSVSR